MRTFPSASPALGVALVGVSIQSLRYAWSDAHRLNGATGGLEPSTLASRASVRRGRACIYLWGLTGCCVSSLLNRVLHQRHPRRGVRVVGHRLERPQDVEGALREARKLKDRTVFMDFRTDPTENVFPMVKAGKGITEMLLGAEDL